MSSDTTRCRTQASALRSWTRCSVGAIVLAIATSPSLVAQSSAGLTGHAPRSLSDTIRTPGSTTVAPMFTEQPHDVATTAYVDARFTVAFTGEPAPALGWQFSADGTNWNDVPGATTAALIVRSPVVAHDGTRWRARLSAPGMAPVFSSAATLSVAKARGEIRIDGLRQAYDGAVHAVTVSTVPPGMAVAIRYLRDGSPADPIEPGSYTVMVEASDANHAGVAEATLVIEPQ